jgi:hypothetical protein
MHDLIEKYLLGSPSVPSDLDMSVDFVAMGYGLYKKLIPKIKRITPEGLETVLWSNSLGVAGRCDCIRIL